MAAVAPVQEHEEFGQTARKDAWWLPPLAVFVGLMVFIVYSTWSGLQGSYFEIRQNKSAFTGPEVAPYLSPFYSPLLYDAQSPHAWINQAKPSWWPNGLHFSAAILILAGPGLFRFTCYYYRKAYYRAFWADPLNCAVGEPRKTYWGENHWPLLLQNAHRYTMYVAVFFLVVLWIDVFRAFWWPTDRAGNLLHGSHQFGMGLGTLIMLINVVLLTGFTFGCNSLRHLCGGRLNSFTCFTCTKNGGPAVARTRPRFYLWRFSTYFNQNHMTWAWLSLYGVGFTDLYIRLCAMGIWKDVRFF